MSAYESDSGIRESRGTKAEGDRKIYRHKAHRGHLREIASRKDNLWIRESPDNEERKGLEKN